jgi:hypothetical protein
MSFPRGGGWVGVHGESDPDLIPTAAFYPTSDIIVNDRGNGDNSRSRARGCYGNEDMPEKGGDCRTTGPKTPPSLVIE